MTDLQRAFRDLLTSTCDADWEEMVSKSRKARIVQARFLYCTFMWRHFELTQDEIGKQLRCHYSTVGYGVQKVDKLLRSRDCAYDQLKKRYAILDQFLTSQNKPHVRRKTSRAASVRRNKTTR